MLWGWGPAHVLAVGGAGQKGRGRLRGFHLWADPCYQTWWPCVISVGAVLVPGAAASYGRSWD